MQTSNVLVVAILLATITHTQGADYSNLPACPSDCPAATGICKCNICKRDGRCVIESCAAGQTCSPDGCSPINQCPEECHQGQYSSTTSTTGCVNCPSGNYQNDNNHYHSKCKKCPIGFSSDLFGVTYPTGYGPTECLACDPGLFASTEAQFPCQNCVFGKSFTSTTTVCENCVGGKYQGSNTIPAVCTDCAPGTYTTNQDMSKCELCATGKYGRSDSEQTSEEHCLPCDDGKYNPYKGQAVCVNCPIGKYMPAKETERSGCLVCESATEEASSSCAGCEQGQFGEIDGQNCQDCEAGKYAGGGFSSCVDCQIGFYSSKTQSSRCEGCDMGKFGAKESKSDELLNNETLACQSCQAGKFGMKSNAIDDSNCRNCDPGFYSKSEGQGGKNSCKPCEAGKRSDRPGRSDGCEECVIGKYFDTVGGSGPCKDCHAGRYSGLPAQWICLFCLPGRSQPKKKQSRCIGCNAGTYTDIPEQQECFECLSGNYQSEGGKTFCLPCTPGKYQTNNRSDTCDNCPIGWIMSSVGGTNCIKVDPGFISVAGGSIAIEISQGWHMTNCTKEDIEVCSNSEPCPTGTFGNVPPSSSCNLCPKGMSSSKGATNCFMCEPGKYSSSIGSSSCRNCDITNAKYSENEKSTHCNTCQIGKESTGKKCVEISINKDLYIPNNIVLSRTSQTNYQELIVSFTSVQQTHHLEWSSSSNFPEKNNLTSRIKIDQNKHTIVLKVPDVREQVTYIRVRSVGVASSGLNVSTDVGSWSLSTIAWKSKRARDCNSNNLYLNASSIDVYLWNCATCPLGGWCEGSKTWENIIATHGWWRDRDNQSSFVKCPNELACLGGSRLNEKNQKDQKKNGNATSTTLLHGCNGKAGYLEICNNTDSNGASSGSCRLCMTCKHGYALASDDITCAKCPDNKLVGFFAFTGLIIVLFVFYGGLVCLKIRSMTRTGENLAKTKAVHSTIKRILLTHMQVVTLCISLQVKWPLLITAIMDVFSTLSSVSRHVGGISCYSDTINPVTRHARFLYYSTAVVLSVPICSVFLLWLYWFIVYPIPGCRCLACGRSDRLIISRPNCCTFTKKAKEIKKEHKKRTRRSTIDTVVKTRDVWSYCVVLLSFILYPSLVRYPMLLMSCRDISRYRPFELYMLLDAEEACFVGRHLTMVLLLAIPGLLLYGIGGPLLAFAILHRHRKHQKTSKYLFRWGLVYSGYRAERWYWELIVVARKLIIIFVTTFLHEPNFQLQVTLLTMMTAFALHHTFLPFDVDDKEQGQLLHRLERNSLLILCLLLWSASVFYFEQKPCLTAFCFTGTNGLAAIVLLLNIMFLFQGIKTFVFHFLKRTHLVDRLTELVHVNVNHEKKEGDGSEKDGLVQKMLRLSSMFSGRSSTTELLDSSSNAVGIELGEMKMEEKSMFNKRNMELEMGVSVNENSMNENPMNKNTKKRSTDHNRELSELMNKDIALKVKQNEETGNNIYKKYSTENGEFYYEDGEGVVSWHEPPVESTIMDCSS